ncbi:hypothetical protein CO058_00565 [candidate division WWE3 bacterium CG_4_9_14_0_2_um_filter_35_11]|uniref:Uncharacterized protein n=1 Tax=candidate division WWE3 bacterium CG_4_9_14_0_2_um_filter_35_11 TaxID=1975077 RepID=A0A2M8EML1_UNCKA|nr:MAG: hypothetical protein COV25_01380 [candidate division WWE3 bacterium CG10_big_fil_rev_8_21_14_0_10_35_32]PJC23969.1 MAG: hypothetical protein CO058_00565 [candidate division WWE3 bacterium CG_4_9_14_0_2_um_filter_35_11]
MAKDKKLELTWYNKDKTKLDKKDKGVFEKAKQTQEWCGMATKTTNKRWKYKLIPHTAVDKVNSFNAIASTTYKF